MHFIVKWKRTSYDGMAVDISGRADVARGSLFGRDLSLLRAQAILLYVFRRGDGGSSDCSLEPYVDVGNEEVEENGGIHPLR